MTRAVPEKHIINFFWPNACLDIVLIMMLSDDNM